MKVNFDVHGSLTVFGDDATEWLALRTWVQHWNDGLSPLVVVGMKDGGEDKFLVADSRQLFRSQAPVTKP